MIGVSVSETSKLLYGYFLGGPTATGKTEIAHFMAIRHGYDIVCADSMSIYRGMDVGTAKPTEDQRAEVRYYGLDLVDPNTPFSVWDYRTYALRTIAQITDSGRRAIIVGGTGLYIKSLIDGLAGMPASDPARRRYWESVKNTRGIEGLQSELIACAPRLYAGLADKHNARRLMRALELADAGINDPPRTWGGGKMRGRIPCLDLPGSDLRGRIDLRVRAMYAAGLVSEVETLIRQYGPLRGTAAQAIGYREAADCAQGRCSLPEAIERTIVRTRQLAKRQRSWFRNKLNVRWIDRSTVEGTARAVSACWKKSGPTAIAG